MDQNQNTQGTLAQNGNSSLLIVGGIVLVVVLAALGWYMMQGNTPGAETQVPAAVNTPPVSTNQQAPDAAITALSTQGSTDDVSAIDKDLKATDLNSLGDASQI